VYSQLLVQLNTTSMTTRSSPGVVSIPGSTKHNKHDYKEFSWCILSHWFNLTQQAWLQGALLVYSQSLVQLNTTSMTTRSSPGVFSVTGSTKHNKHDYKEFSWCFDLTEFMKYLKSTTLGLENQSLWQRIYSFSNKFLIFGFWTVIFVKIFYILVTLH